MKITKRILSVLLSILMLTSAVSLTGITVNAAPTGSAVVYLKTGGNGNGTSPDSPMGNINTAMNAVITAGGGKVVLVGPVEIPANTDAGKGDIYDVNIVLTSLHNGVDYRKTAEAALIFTGPWKNLEVHSPIEFENMDIVTGGTNCSIYANGFPVVLGNGINCRVADGVDAKTPSNYLGIYGGSAHDLSGTKNFPANTSITVLSGTYFNIKGGGKGTSDNPRPSLSASITLGKDVKVMGEVNFDFNENGVVEGEKILITANGFNEAANDLSSEATRCHEITGDGYVSGTHKGPGNYLIQASTGNAVKVGGEFVENGEYANDEKSISFAFEKSDLNKEYELSLLRPTLSSAFPGEYIKGYDNGDGTFSFKPSGNITIAEASTILVRLLTDETQIKGQYTTERAKAEDWFYDNIAFIDSFDAYESFDNFDGNRQITRAEFVALISTFKKLSAKAEEITFTDVDETHKYYKAVKAGTMAKLVNGYDNGDGTFSFKPDAPITRAEVVTVINRVFDMADIAPIKYKELLPNFSDVDETHWAAYQIIAAAGGKERPKEKVDLSGTGEVEFEAFGEVVFIKDGGTGDGSSAENAASYNDGHKMIKDSGTLVVCGPVTYPGNVDITLGNSGKVLVTSVYDGVDYRETADAALIFGRSWVNAVPRSETILDNIAIISKGTNCSIYCDNQKFTIGKDVVCINEEGGGVIGIYAGSANDLSSCVNYIGSESTHVSHNGNYFGNLTINGGTWGNITGYGKGSEAKPRESLGTVVSIGEGATIGSVVCGVTDKVGSKVNGLRTMIFNNYTKAIVNPEDFDIIVKTPAGVTAEAIDIKSDEVTIKIYAEDGKKIAGLSEEGTVTLYGEGSVTVTETASGYEAVKAGKDGAGDLDDAAAEMVTDEYLSELDALEAKRYEEIKATKSEIKPKEGRTAYYVSFTDGDDANDGKSEDKPWKTITKVNSSSFLSGDVVYFKRGDEWRGITPLSCKPGVSYSAYGEGAKPIINLSPFDGAKTGKWTLVEGYENLYVYSEKIPNDVGSVSFNNRTYTDIYAQKIVYDWKNGKPYERSGAAVSDVLSTLKNDLDFYHDCGGPYDKASADKGQLYMRSDKGNPAERFQNIEFNPKTNGIAAASNVTIDNINVRHAGVHGVGAGTVDNLRVQNCIFEWIGGSVQTYNYDGQGKAVRLGNAVEVYGGCDGYTVDNCYIKNVYDAGVTHQVSDSSGGDYVMKNVTYSNNVILNCVYSIEHFNRQPSGQSTQRYLVNILYKDNLCRYAGECFGGYTRPDKSVCAHIRSGGLVDTANFVIEGNIFDRSTDNMFTFHKGGDEEIQWKNNTYIHKLSAKYGTLQGVTISYNSNVQNEVNKRFKSEEIGGKYLFIKN